MDAYRRISNYIEIENCKKMNNDCHFAIGCIICTEPVRLTKDEETCLLNGRDVHNKICDKCKHAILHVRKQLEDHNNGGNEHDKNV